MTSVVMTSMVENCAAGAVFWRCLLVLVEETSELGGVLSVEDTAEVWTELEAEILEDTAEVFEDTAEVWTEVEAEVFENTAEVWTELEAEVSEDTVEVWTELEVEDVVELEGALVTAEVACELDEAG